MSIISEAQKLLLDKAFVEFVCKTKISENTIGKKIGRYLQFAGGGGICGIMKPLQD